MPPPADLGLSSESRPAATTTTTTERRDFAVASDGDSDDAAEDDALFGDGDERSARQQQRQRQRLLQTGAASSHGGQQQLQQLQLPPISTMKREGNGDKTQGEEETEKEKMKREGPVSWSSLPRKTQLVILTVARLSEPLVQTSLQSYMFFQLRSFDPTLSDAVISGQAGVLTASFTAAQFLTAMLWGRVSDSQRGGRKLVLLIGLSGTLLSCLGFGFATSFWQAIFFRSLGGAVNGNVGVLRTMISEIIKEKKYQAKAFLLLPMCFNIGVIIGPILGGLLADPAGSYPSTFGGIKWLEAYPYAPPNILSATFLLAALIAVFFGLEETLPALRDKDDFGVSCRRALMRYVRRLRRRNDNSDATYHRVAGADPHDNQDGGEPLDMEMSPVSAGKSNGSSSSSSSKKKRKVAPRYTTKLPFRRIFTRNVICTLVSHSLLATHVGTFNSLFFVFLSTPVQDPAHPDPPSHRRRLPFVFTGGIGMPSRDVGLALAVLGTFGICLQLLVYPAVNARLGTVRSWRIFLYGFPLAYLLVPFLSVVPSATAPPAEKDGALLWLGLCVVLAVQVVARTFALPATTILLNNCSPHPSVLGTVHGVGQTVSSAARTLGPVVGGALYGLGLRVGVVGLAFWTLSLVALCNCAASNWVFEGDGHEIRLDGDDEAEAEAELANADIK